MARDGTKTGGGSRAGKPNRSREELREIINQISKARAQNKVEGLKLLVKRLFELGEGIQVKKETEAGPVIYSQPPSEDAIKTILDYRFGKAVQPFERGDEEPENKNVNVIFLPRKREEAPKNKPKGK